MFWTLSMTLLALVLVGLAVVGATPTATFEASVKDQAGNPVADAVVSATLPGAPVPATGRKTAIAVMAQRNEEFVPHVLPVQVGTTVQFPNHDSVRHHIYSFSSAKKFERALYAGAAVEPATFDTPGHVALGCNIHDWMLGHIYVVNTPYFAKTARNGAARVDSMPPGEYDIRVWHPRMSAGNDTTVQRAGVAAASPVRATFVISLKPEIPRPRSSGY
jgi:plastocyanin